MSIYFTSDLHLRHKNILQFENRPYETVEEMNQELIDIWNNTVKKNDTVYNLGDFCFGSYDKWVEILEQLNGKIIHIKGNHDSSETLNKLYKNGYLDEIHMVGHYLKMNKQVMHLTHYPMDIGNRPRLWSLHGHIHSHPSQMPNQINLCVDSPLNFGREFGKPIHLDELMEYMDRRLPVVEAAFQMERESR
ncbi:metallophosphoesterase [Lederbergia citrisecunda]|uniref:metallophosphoesterase n=1 Tax=Lederbergia citrisecunda TaxID=2833583 RepID=UPI003D2D846A